MAQRERRSALQVRAPRPGHHPPSGIATWRLHRWRKDSPAPRWSRSARLGPHRTRWPHQRRRKGFSHQTCFADHRRQNKRLD
eukprot:1707759-Pyramimonas_sp.AAC.1